MKKILTFIIIVLLLSTGVTAQEKYYYCDGNKVPLTEQISKAVVITQKTAAAIGDGNNVIQAIEDTELNIQVIEGSLSIQKVKGISNLNYHMLSYDCTKKTSPTATYGDHGTHCAGIAAAVRNNGIQVSGVAPDAKIMAAGVNFSNSNAISGLADGINWAWQNGADVISCSWTCAENDMIKKAIDNAVTKGREGKGCVFVKSAGNRNSSITFPGAYRKEVIAVASLKIDGNRRSDSSFGDNMLVSAPGDSILSTVNNNGIDYKGGTSMACPHVAGVAALILSRNPALSALKVREIIAKSTKQVGNKPYDITKEFGKWNKWYGYGMIDAYKAVINTPRN